MLTSRPNSSSSTGPAAPASRSSAALAAVAAAAVAAAAHAPYQQGSEKQHCHRAVLVATLAIFISEAVAWGLTVTAGQLRYIAILDSLCKPGM